MKLSEAIMKGSKMRPQTFNTLHDATGSCALGAALDAVSNELGYCVYLNSYFPILKIKIQCQKCDFSAESNLFGVIIHLNDYHRVEREWIAMWVKELEDKKEAGLL